ncbi:MAG: hypothetical protein ACREDW_00025 [Aestuariivirgaceae bacterium]
MTAFPSPGNGSPAILLPRRSARIGFIARLTRLFHRREVHDGLRTLSDIQLRDIGIERHRIGPSIDPDRTRRPSW